MKSPGIGWAPRAALGGLSIDQWATPGEAGVPAGGSRHGGGHGSPGSSQVGRITGSGDSSVPIAERVTNGSVGGSGGGEVEEVQGIDPGQRVRPAGHLDAPERLADGLA